MLRAIKRQFQTFPRIVAMVALVVTTALSVPAHAATVQDLVGIIEVTPDMLLVQLASGVNYQAFTANAPAGCATVSTDTIRAWLTMSQGALLAQKQLKVYFNTCSGANNITTLDLSR